MVRQKGVLMILLKALLGETCLSNSSRGHEENYVRFAHFSFEVSLKQNLPLGLKVKKIKKKVLPSKSLLVTVQLTPEGCEISLHGIPPSISPMRVDRLW